MTETLPTRKEVDFNDFLVGFERFGDYSCDSKDAPDDLDGLEHYCKALAFTLTSDLSGMRSRLHGRCFGMGADDDFLEAESMGYALQHTATRILALAQIGVQAACHLKELKAKAKGGA